LKIDYEVTEHSAVFTVEEADGLDLDSHGKGTKNLFLRDDKKQNFYVVVLCNDKRADLRDMRAKLGSRPLTFASLDSLAELLKLKRGAVTPFGVINDVERKVKVVFDEDVFKFDRIGQHPNDNTATLWLSPFDLKKAIEEIGNETIILSV
jgi:Ala-tRNA(Pro) deacylase